MPGPLAVCDLPVEGTQLRPVAVLGAVGVEQFDEFGGGVLWDVVQGVPGLPVELSCRGVGVRGQRSGSRWPAGLRVAASPRVSVNRTTGRGSRRL